MITFLYKTIHSYSPQPSSPPLLPASQNGFREWFSYPLTSVSARVPGTTPADHRYPSSPTSAVLLSYTRATLYRRTSTRRLHGLDFTGFPSSYSASIYPQSQSSISIIIASPIGPSNRIVDILLLSLRTSRYVASHRSSDRFLLSISSLFRRPPSPWHDPASPSRPSHPQIIYNTFFKRNSVFVSTVFLSAFTFSIGFDLATSAWWDAHNRGVSESLHFVAQAWG